MNAVTHVRDLLAQPRVVGHSQRLHGGDQILADELAGPGHQLRHGLAVAHAEHLEHAGICLRRAQQPVLDVGLDALADRAGEPEPGPRLRIEDQGSRLAEGANLRSST